MADPPHSNVKRLRTAPRILTGDGSEAHRVPVPECSFCGRPLGEARYLLVTKTARICEQCVGTFSELVGALPRGE